MLLRTIGEGDYDFNDVVMPYIVKIFYNSDNELVKSRLIYLFKARVHRSQMNRLSFLTDPLMFLRDTVNRNHITKQLMVLKAAHLMRQVLFLKIN